MTEEDEEVGTLDLNALMVEAEAEAGTAEPDDPSGPEELGELLEDDDQDAADEDGDEADDSDLEDDSEDDGDDVEDPEEEVSTDDDEDVDEDDSDDEVDPRLLELEREAKERRREADELRAQNQQLLAMLNGTVPSKQSQQPKRDPEFDAAWKAAHVGGGEAIKDYSPAIQRQVGDLARQLQEARAEWALNPEAEFNTRFAPLVEQMIERRMAPYQQTHQQQELESILEPHRGFLETNRDLVKQHLPTLGADSSDPRVMRERLEVAVRLAKAALAEGKTKKREQRVKTKERQNDARKRSRRNGSRKPRRGRSKPPVLEGVDGSDLQRLARQLEANPALLEQAEEELGH